MEGSIPSEKSTVISGWDWIRLFTVLSIAFFHAWQLIFYKDITTFTKQQPIYYFLADGLKHIGIYSGVMILAQSFLMFGFNDTKMFSEPLTSFSIRARWVLLVLGVLILQILTVSDPVNPSTWTWDIYSFLILAFLLCRLLRKAKPLLRRILIGISIVPLLLPDSFWLDSFIGYFPNSSFNLFLIGHGNGEFFGWNLLPWIFVPVVFYLSGIELGAKFRKSETSFNLWLLEMVAWPICFLLLFMRYQSYDPVPVGPSFDAFIFHHKPLLFWQHFSVFIFLLRLSVITKVNLFLKQAPLIGALTKQISKLAWCRHFGWTYLIQLTIYLSVGMDVYNWNSHPRQFDYLWLVVLLTAEVCVRIAFSLRRKAKLQIAKSA